MNSDGLSEQILTTVLCLRLSDYFIRAVADVSYSVSICFMLTILCSETQLRGCHSTKHAVAIVQIQCKTDAIVKLCAHLQRCCPSLSTCHDTAKYTET